MLIGLAVAAPVGPMSILSIQRTLWSGLAAGIACGAGIALAAATYSAIAAFGLTSISKLLVDHETDIRLVEELILGFMGWRIATSRAPADQPAANLLSGHPTGDFATTFGLTLMNPMTILSFAAIFTAVGINSGSTRQEASMVVIGVFAGSIAWWLMLLTIVNRLKARISAGWIRRINLLAGGMIVVFGILSIWSTIR
jgi:putative LysE/RhtB family amino acid efflux pump